MENCTFAVYNYDDDLVGTVTAVDHEAALCEALGFETNECAAQGDGFGPEQTFVVDLLPYTTRMEVLA